MTRRCPVVLVVCDGWGHNPDHFGNAIAAARTPVMDRLMAAWPWTVVAASGESVGLPSGQQGNSEVGHLTLGSGRVIHQPLSRINLSIRDGSFFTNPVLCAAVDRARDHGHRLHCLALVSPGGVHSHQDHVVAMARLAAQRGLSEVVIHAFTDGRDEPPTSAGRFLQHLIDELHRVGAGVVGTVSGRYYAMDRDRRWERTRRAYDILVEGGGSSGPENPVEYVRDQHAAGITDEFVEPRRLIDPGRSVIADGDSVVFVNFRPDRARQLSHALVDDDFEGFERSRRPRDLFFATFTEYQSGLTPHVAFPRQVIHGTLAEIVSEHGFTQFHVAETEKYAHVTYFVNGGRENPFAGEERHLVPSPKVATYDVVPEMSAEAITQVLCERIERAADGLIVVNYANPDMVGHTGDFAATVAAVEVVDRCLGRVANATLAAGGALMVTADHGNAELKVDRHDNSPLTAHTTSPVPVVLCGSGERLLRPGGSLSDVAPTLLELMGLPVSEGMTGRSLTHPAEHPMGTR